MEKLIVIKYGELTTKKDNIRMFLKQLKTNIEFNLKDINHEVTYDQGRMFIKTNEYDKVLDILENIFGIHEIFIGYLFEGNDLDIIKKEVLYLIKDKTFKTFKVETKRSDKNIPFTSVEISKQVGGYILANINDRKVDIHNPEMLINIEIRYNKFIIYFESVKGLGGYPVSSLGKGLLMLSGGIDSPVAGYLAIKRGVKLECIYFESPPHTSDEAKEKVKTLARKLALYNNDIKLHIVNLTSIQESIYKNIPRDYLITILRRMMYRISAIIASKNNCKVLINGESIGQVASQTLTSMRVINSVVNVPVIRPVACFDKLEIIDIAKKINTYETSILPFIDCCTVFVPKHPVINPTMEICEEYEKLINYQDLIYEAIKNAEVIKLSSKEENKYPDLF